MSLEIRFPEADLLGFSDFTVTVLDTTDSGDENNTVASDSLVVIEGVVPNTYSSSNYFRINLPSSPDAGDIIRFKNLASGDNADFIQIQSATIEGTAQTLEIDHQVDFFLIYVNATTGWIVMG